MDALMHVLITVAVVLMIMIMDHFAPRLFFVAIFLIARHTAFGAFMTWRTCQSVYCTNDAGETACDKVTERNQLQRHFKTIGGVAAPRNLDGLRLVPETLTIVNFGRRYVAWSDRAPDRIRMFGFLHDGKLLYGTWYDWQDGSRYRGVVMMDFDLRRTEAHGVWAGGPLLSTPQYRVRVFPWVWTDIAMS